MCTRVSPSFGRPCPEGVSVLDLVYVLGVIALFAVIGLVAKGVEKL